MPARGGSDWSRPSAEATLSRVEDACAHAPPRAEAPDLEDPSLYFNRELSWLDFNDRVLQLAEDASVPLLERVKFCAIWESNLDEFFMVRVANLHDQVEAGVDARGADGISASEQIDAIRERVVAQRERLERCFERELRPALAEHGIRIVSATSADRRTSSEELRPALPQAGVPGADAARDRPRAAVPLHLEPVAQPGGAAARPRPGQRGPGPGEGAEGAARPLPLDGRTRPTLVAARGSDRRQPRLAVPGHGGARPLVLPGHARHRLRRLRRGRRPAAGGRGGAAPPPLRRGRAAGGRARDEPSPARAAGRRRWRSRSDQVYEVDGMLDISDLCDIAGIKGFAELRDPPYTPVTQPRLLGEDGDEARRVRRDARGRHRSSTIPTTRSPPRSSASSSRRSRTPTCSRSSRPSTGRAPTRRSSRR